jgi:hypothetical protein
MMPTLSDAIAKARQEQLRQEAEQDRLARLRTRGDPTGPDGFSRQSSAMRWRALLPGSSKHGRAVPKRVPASPSAAYSCAGAVPPTCSAGGGYSSPGSGSSPPPR